MHEFTWRSPTGGNLAPSYLEHHLETYEPAYVLAVQVLCAGAAYIFAKFACKYDIQPAAFALPLALVTPVVVVGLAAMCAVQAGDACVYSGYMPDHLFFRCPVESASLGWIGSELGWAWLLWLLSQVFKRCK
jgi:hypothetical protein